MNKLKKSKGFTLIELLVALSIVMIILLTFFKVIDNTTKMNVKNDIDVRALKLAKSEIENLRNQIKSKSQLNNIKIENVISKLDSVTEEEEKKGININESFKNQIKLEQNTINIPLQIIPEENEEYEVIYIKKSLEDSANLQDTNLKKEKFKIYLDISKSDVKYEKNNSDTGLDMYKINIKVKNMDSYFSKKFTELNDIEILSKNS